MLKPIFLQQEREDFKWALEHCQEWTSKHADKWVAVYQKKLISVGENAEQAEKKAKEKIGRQCFPIMMFIEGGPYVY